MKKHLKALVLSLSLIAGSASAAVLSTPIDLQFDSNNASLINLDISDHGISDLQGGSPFYGFTLSTPGNISFNGFVLGLGNGLLNNLYVQLDGKTWADVKNFDFRATDTLFATSLSAGQHTLSFLGNATANYEGVGTFVLTRNVTDIPAVPEPETYALMGLGLVGLLASRRRKAQ